MEKGHKQPHEADLDYFVREFSNARYPKAGLEGQVGLSVCSLPLPHG